MCVRVCTWVCANESKSERKKIISGRKRERLTIYIYIFLYIEGDRETEIEIDR